MRNTPETDAEVARQQPWQDQRWADFARRLERERDEAREHLKAIEEYGTEEINAAVELRQKLAVALVERDEAIARCERQRQRIIYLEGATNHATGTPLGKAIEERDKAREELAELNERFVAKCCKEARLQMLVDEKVALRRELEAELGITSEMANDESLQVGLEAIRKLKRERDEARDILSNDRDHRCSPEASATNKED